MSSPSPLAEATSGVIGSLISMLTFYPLDVHKTRVQSSNKLSSPPTTTQTKSKSVDLLLRILSTFTIPNSLAEAKQTLSPHYVGVQYKIIDTTVSSFTFFFILTLLKQKYKKMALLNPSSTLTPHVNLMLSSLAAMANTAITLPLDGVVTRKQTSAASEPVQPKLSPWAGLEPALMLSSNPAIHFTVYDVLKSAIVKDREGGVLSGFEAFLVGLIAKSVATIITYPLIRAKQIMMSGNAKDATLQQTTTKIYHDEGVAGLYRGLELQLGHTVCKAALLMSIREQISNITKNPTFLYLFRARKARNIRT